MTSSEESQEHCDVSWPDIVENKIPLSLSIFKVKIYKQFQPAKLK